MLTYYWTPPAQNFPPFNQGSTMPVREESYIENILRLNRGKPGTFYFSFEHAVAEGRNTVSVRGVVEAAGRDHVILRELKTNYRYLFPMIYFDYAQFDEELAYFTQTP